MAEGTGFCLPVLVGDLDADLSSFSSLPDHFSGIPVRDTVTAMLGLPRAVKVQLLTPAASAAAKGPWESSEVRFADLDPGAQIALPGLAAMVASASALLRGQAKEGQLSLAQAQYRALRHNMLELWRKVEAVLAQGVEVGRGGFSVVYGGDSDLGRVAVKAMRVSGAEAHRLKAFEREVAVMRLLDHPVRLPAEIGLWICGRLPFAALLPAGIFSKIWVLGMSTDKYATHCPHNGSRD